MDADFEFPDERQTSDPHEQAAEVFHNFDELLERMELDEKQDAPLITPVNYAKLRPSLTPQSVYYRIRTGKLKTYLCPCGRKCIKLEEADKLFFKPKDEDASDADV
jgi:hypothetical protein